MEQLRNLYTAYTGAEPASVERLTGAGSNRQYFRMKDSDGHSLIGVIGTIQEECHSFIYLARHFKGKDLPVPEVYAVSEDEMRYLQQDLGSRSLYDALKAGREAGGKYNEYEVSLLKKTIKGLVRMQVVGAHGLDWNQCYPTPRFDKTSIMFDLNYFKYMFLKLTGVEFNEVKLECDFEKLTGLLLECESRFFMYRDFQARNIMLDDNDNLYFIDFQGGRCGPVYYDLASFLWQSSAKYDMELRYWLFSEYFAEAKGMIADLSVWQNSYYMNFFILFRILQVLGAYGFRGYIEHKKYFVDSIPAALDNLRGIIEKNGLEELPYLKQVCNEVIAKQQKPFCHENLIVRVFSFSYKKGIPDDVSGNGGGYVFDCRSTNNPGRYKEYKTLTGRDIPVIEFLEKDGEILQFLDNVYPLVDFHVQRWLDRGFTDLQISFGCTGGQHRSVYSAQHVAEHIHKKFGVEVHLCHREQGIKEVLK